MKYFEVPEIEVVKFNVEDVITTSTTYPTQEDEFPPIDLNID